MDRETMELTPNINEGWLYRKERKFIKQSETRGWLPERQLLKVDLFGKEFSYVYYYGLLKKKKGETVYLLKSTMKKGVYYKGTYKEIRTTLLYMSDENNPFYEFRSGV